MKELTEVPARVIAEVVKLNPGRELVALRMLGISAQPNSSNLQIIKALAEAFRALEQRAEAAEAQVAELEKQEHYVEVMKDGPMTICHWTKPAKELPDGAKLFTRPAPAINLAELVPDEMTPKQASRSYGGEVIGYRDGFNACIAEIMRNIEEAK